MTASAVRTIARTRLSMLHMIGARVVQALDNGGFRVADSRPEVGKPINIRLGAELLSAVDQAREVSGQSRADLLRDLVSQALAARQDTAERA